MSLRVRLLMDCRTAFGDIKVLPAAELLTRLKADPEAHCAELGGDGLKPLGGSQSSASAHNFGLGYTSLSSLLTARFAAFIMTRRADRAARKPTNPTTTANAAFGIYSSSRLSGCSMKPSSSMDNLDGPCPGPQRSQTK